MWSLNVSVNDLEDVSSGILVGAKLADGGAVRFAEATGAAEIGMCFESLHAGCDASAEEKLHG